MTTKLDDRRKQLTSSEAMPPPNFEGNPAQTTTEETFKVSGESLWHKIKEMIRQGNVRRILIKNESGHLLLEIPVTAGFVGGLASLVLFPEITAIGVIGSMFAHLTLTIERHSTQPHNSEHSE